MMRGCPLPAVSQGLPHRLAAGRAGPQCLAGSASGRSTPGGDHFTVPHAFTELRWHPDPMMAGAGGVSPPPKSLLAG